MRRASLIDLHTHTTLSLDSALEPGLLIAAAKGSGLTAVCLTEHDNLWSPSLVRQLEEEHGFFVFRGIEVTTEWGHVLVYGVRRYVAEMRVVKRLRRIVDEEGGVMVLAHPFSPGMNVNWQELPHLFDGLETLNAATSGHEAYLAQMAQEWGLCSIGGSDAHSMAEVGLCATSFERPVHSEEDLVRELRARRCCPVHRRGGKSFPYPAPNSKSATAD